MWAWARVRMWCELDTGDWLWARRTIAEDGEGERERGVGMAVKLVVKWVAAPDTGDALREWGRGGGGDSGRVVRCRRAPPRDEAVGTTGSEWYSRSPGAAAGDESSVPPAVDVDDDDDGVVSLARGARLL